MKNLVTLFMLLVAGITPLLGGCALNGQANAAGSTKSVLLETEDLVYVACEDADEVAILRVKDGMRVGSIKVGAAPHDVAYDPLSRRAYVTSGDGGTVSVIETGSQRVVDEILVGGQPQGVALSKGGRFLYVADSSSNVVVVADTSANKVASTISVGEGPESLAFAPDYRKLYVVNLRSNSVSVIDPETNRVVRTIMGGRGPSGIAISPDGSKVFLGGHGQHGSGKPMTNKYVLVIDSETGRQLGTIEAGSMPVALMLAESGKYLYAVCHGSNDLWAVDADVDSNGVFASRSSARVKVGEDPRALTTAGGGRFIFVANASSNDVSIVDTLGNRLIATVPVGKRPTGLAVVY